MREEIVRPRRQAGASARPLNFTVRGPREQLRLALNAIGNARESGCAVFVASPERLEDLPSLVSPPCARFVLLLAHDNERTPARLEEVLGELLDRGCVYLCAWGPGCEHVHDTMDDVVLERELKGGPKQTIMTTWHSDEALSEAVDFALRHARPVDALAHDSAAIVLAAVGNPAWAKALRNAAEPLVTPSVL